MSEAISIKSRPIGRAMPGFSSRYPLLSTPNRSPLAACFDEIFQRRNMPDVAARRVIEQTDDRETLIEGVNRYFKENGPGVRTENISIDDIETMGKKLRKKHGYFIPYIESRMERDDDIVVCYRGKDDKIEYGLIESLDAAGEARVPKHITIRILSLKPERPARHLVFSQVKLMAALRGPSAGLLVVGDGRTL